MLPIVQVLASQGLSLLANAVMAKGKEVVEEKLGVSLDTTPPAELRKLEIEHEEFLLDAAIRQAEIELKDKALDISNTQSARDMNTRIQESSHAAEIAKVAPYYLDFLIVIATLILAAFLFFVETPTVNKELLYMAFGSLLTMCGTILNFHRGTSASSKTKDNTIHSLLSGDEGGMK